MTEAAAGRRVTFSDVLADREFRALYVAQALSVVGDQLARIAIALLVFERSGSALLTALTYALTFLPWLVGGVLLSSYADRLPRKRVMIACDLTRAALMLGLVSPHVPLAVAMLVVAAVSVFQPPFNAARSALLSDIFPDSDRYAAAAALGATTNQLGQVLGFAAGGAIVAATSARGAIITDTVAFVVSALLVIRYVAPRPAAALGEASALADVGEVVRFIRRHRGVRDAVLGSYAVVAATIAPESIAVPYASRHGGGPLAAGLLTASVPLGMMLGAIYLSRVVGQHRAERWMRLLALASACVLALTAFDPPPAAAMLIWIVGGACSAMVVTSSTYVARLTPHHMRGRVFGILGTGLAVVQGIFAVLAGWVAEALGPATAVADMALPVAAALTILVAAGSTRSSSTQASSPIVDLAIQPPEETVITKPPRARRPEQQMWAATAILAIVATVLALLVRPEEALLDPRVPTWWFLALFIIVQAYPLQFEFRRTTREMILDSIALVLGLFFLAPITLIVWRVIAKVLTAIMNRRSPLRISFNAAGGALTTAAAALIFRALVAGPPSAHLRAWPAVVVAVVADDIVTAGIVMWPGYVYNSGLNFRSVWSPLAFSTVVNLVTTCLGLVTAGAIRYEPANAWVMAIFMVLTLAGFRTYHRLADRHAVLDRLYALAKDLGPITSDPADIGPAIAQLRELLRSSQLEIVLLRDGDGATVIAASDDEGPGAIRARDTAADDEALALVRGATEARTRRRWPLRTKRPAALSPEAMAVPVAVAGQPVGVLRALSNVRTGRVFDRNDLRLLESAADQLGAALEKGRLIERLRRAATRDSLTGLANLDSLRTFLSAMLAEQSGGVLLLLDVDRFHDINDTLGHEAGDAVLIEVARRLEDAATHGSLACRVGGDQFALVIPGQSNSELARLAALAVKSRIDGSLRLDTVAADVRVTIGMARSPEHGDDATTILRRAEIAMGAAKGGSTGIGEWEPQMERDGSRRLYVLSGLRQALADSDLTVEFQPKLRLGTGEVTGFEALVRWRHPELGLVSPVEFIPLAEATGLVGALTSTVLRQALEACRRWHDSGRPVGVAVNISARSLDDPVLVGQVAALLTASGLDGRSLTLEITESSVMENPGRSLEVLRQLRSLGIRLSIDDFGTGYSSLHQLRGLPVHEVKIDKTFVDNIDRDGADRAVIRAVVELCDSLGLTTVAEGVEQATQAYALETLGVHEVQGYFYGRPMPEPDAFAWLKQRAVANKLSEERQRG